PGLRCRTPVQWYPAGCPSGQWERSVKPSRKLRRFEPFTRHKQEKRPLTWGNRSGADVVTVSLGLVGTRSISLVPTNTRQSLRRLCPLVPGSQSGLNAPQCGLLLPVDALRIDFHEYVNAMPGPLRYPGCRYPRVEPQRYGGVSQVVRPP